MNESTISPGTSRVGAVVKVERGDRSNHKGS